MILWSELESSKNRAQICQFSSQFSVKGNVFGFLKFCLWRLSTTNGKTVTMNLCMRIGHLEGTSCFLFVLREGGQGGTSRLREDGNYGR